MLSISRNTPQAHNSLKNGVWKKGKLKGTELAYKTLGLLGCGRIGQKVAQIAKRGFDMEVIGYDIKPCFESGIKFMTKEEVLAKADYISIHTGGKDVIIGEKELALMKNTAYIINTSRGSNIDQQALYNALKRRQNRGRSNRCLQGRAQIGGRPEFNDKLKELDNVVLSSHLGASTVEAQRETSTEIARVVSAATF